jgi:hypothetical protein
MDNSILYSSIEDINIISRWDAGQKFCIRITIGDGSVLLQVTLASFSRHRLLGINAWWSFMLTLLLATDLSP